MTMEEMKQRKIELGYSYEQISVLSGVPVGTVQKIFGGVTKSPRYETLRALEKVLNRGIRSRTGRIGRLYFGQYCGKLHHFRL